MSRFAQILFIALISCSVFAAPQSITAIKAGRIVDPASGTTATNQIILVADGKISAVGASLPIPSNAKVIDLSGRTVLPGLVDAHTHLCASIDPKWDLGDFWIYAVQHRNGFRAILGAKHAKEMLEAGFTSVRDVGNSGDYADFDLVKAIELGIVPGPTMIAAGRIIAPFGGQFWDSPADHTTLNTPEYYFADSHDELRKAIRENIYYGSKWNLGAQVIKIVVDGQKYIYSADDIKFIVDEAAAAGIKVAAHAQTKEGVHNAIEGGVASVEHAWYVSDEDVELANKKGIVFVTTDFTVRELMAGGMSEEDAARTHAKWVARLRRIFNDGATVVFGTDIMSDVKGVTRGQLAIEYIDSFVEAGIPAKAILKAMTTDAVRLLGISDQRGSIKVGQAADLIAVTKNPLEDIQTLKSVQFVMKDGTVIRSEDKQITSTGY